MKEKIYLILKCIGGVFLFFLILYIFAYIINSGEEKEYKKRENYCESHIYFMIEYLTEKHNLNITEEEIISLEDDCMNDFNDYYE